MEKMLNGTLELLGRKSELETKLLDLQKEISAVKEQLSDIDKKVEKSRSNLISKEYVGKNVHISKDHIEVYMKVDDVLFDDNYVFDLTVKYKGTGFSLDNNGNVTCAPYMTVCNFNDGNKFEIEIISEEKHNETFKKAIEKWMMPS